MEEVEEDPIATTILEMISKVPPTIVGMIDEMTAMVNAETIDATTTMAEAINREEATAEAIREVTVEAIREVTVEGTNTMGVTTVEMIAGTTTVDVKSRDKITTKRDAGLSRAVVMRVEETRMVADKNISKEAETLDMVAVIRTIDPHGLSKVDLAMAAAIRVKVRVMVVRMEAVVAAVAMTRNLARLHNMLPATDQKNRICSLLQCHF